MNFFVRMAVIIAIVVALLLLVQHLNESGGARGTQPAAAAVATPTPTPAATPARATSAYPMLGATPPPTTPSPTRPPARAYVPPRPSACNQVDRAASQVGAVVVSCASDGGMIVATIQARERNALGDFLDAAMRLGMRDFDVNQQRYQQMTDRQGRAVYQNTFRMRW